MKNLSDFINENILDTDKDVVRYADNKALCFAIDEMLKSGKKNPELIKLLESKVAVYSVNDTKLVNVINKYIKIAGYKCSLNWIDTSKNMDLSFLFNTSKFNGDISKWDVSKVDNMVSMFDESKFNGDISKWDVSNVLTMRYMFSDSQFNSDISKWKINPACDSTKMFQDCPIKEEYKPKF